MLVATSVGVLSVSETDSVVFSTFGQLQFGRFFAIFVITIFPASVRVTALPSQPIHAYTGGVSLASIARNPTTPITTLVKIPNTISELLYILKNIKNENLIRILYIILNCQVNI